MRHQLTLALAFALVALAMSSAVVKPSAARTPLAVGLSCECIAYARQLCHADVDGGTPPYTYQWGPPPVSGSSEFKIIPCAGSGTRPVSVTVTDANGQTVTHNGLLQCCGESDPR